MNRIEKYSIIGMAVIGAMAGLWGAYTAYDASRFQQPLDEHSKIVLSFQNQIASAEKHREEPDVIRVRLDYEKYEESWRNGRRLSALVSPIENLAAHRVTEVERSEISQLLDSIGSTQAPLLLGNRTLGAAYFAVGSYDRASEHFLASSTERPDQSTVILRAASLSRLSQEQQDPNLKQLLKKDVDEALRGLGAMDKLDDRSERFLLLEGNLHRLIEASGANK
jgi:hypothetical protein